MDDRERIGPHGLLSSAARRGHSFLVGALLWLFTIAVAVLIIAALSASAWTNRITRSEALHTGQLTVAAIAEHTVAPLITDQLTRGDAAAYRALDEAVQARLRDGTIAMVLLWDEQGRILYSDAPDLVGQRFALEADDLRTLRMGGTNAELQTTPASRHAFEQGVDGALLEVYAGVRGRDGKPYLLEAYLLGSQVEEARGRLLGRVLRGLVALLAVATLLQLPLAFFLAKRNQRAREERRRLERRAHDASATERRKLAQSIHDEVLQDLAGLGYALSATSGQSSAGRDPAAESILDTAGTIVHRSVLRLRQILSDMYELQAAETNLADMVTTISMSLEEQGARVDIQIDSRWGDLKPRERALLLRVMRESLRNVSSHAQAKRVLVRLSCEKDRVTLLVSDDGVGFDPAALDAPASGHVGLDLLRDDVNEAGGVFWVDSTPRKGSRVNVVLPVVADAQLESPMATTH